MVKKSSWPSQICSHVASSTFALIGCVFRFLSNQIGIKSKWRKKGSQSVSTFFSGSQLANSKLMALMVTRNECIKFECPPHEHTFHILMLQNPSFDVVVPEVHKIRWSRDCEAQKWWKGRSGSSWQGKPLSMGLLLVMQDENESRLCFESFDRGGKIGMYSILGTKCIYCC